MHIETDRALIPARTPAARHLTVTITAPARKHPLSERSPVAVSLVLDRSGSMDGRKIEMARKAVAHAIQLLNDRDQFAVVVYDDQIDTIVERTAASKEARANALARLANIDARGSTDLAGGWFHGVTQATAEADVRRVLLLSDGLANHGIVDHDELRQAAARFRAAGVTTSTFGVGADFDEELMASIATHGGGHFYFIEKPRQIADFLTSELGETLEIVARNAVFDVMCGPGVEVMLLNDMPCDQDEGRMRVRLGDLVADQQVTLVLAITCAPRAAEHLAFVDCRVTDRDNALFHEPMRVEWRAADVSENERQPVNHAVLVTVAEVMAERARAMALAANRRSEFEEARRVIRDIAEHLRGLDKGNRAIDAIIDRLVKEEERLLQPMSALARKSAHFEAYTLAQSRDVSGRARKRQS